MSIIESASRLDIAIDAWRTDPRHAKQHLEAALAATGELQRALILELLRMEQHLTPAISGRATRKPHESR
jgi:hypothetical protein